MVYLTQCRYRPASCAICLSVKSIQDLVAASIGGQSVGQILQGDRRFDFVVRLDDGMRTPQQLAMLPIQLPNGGLIKLQDVAKVENILGLAQVSRENGKRRVVVTTNVRDRDLGSFVGEMQREIISAKITKRLLVCYGGQFGNHSWAKPECRLWCHWHC